MTIDNLRRGGELDLVLATLQDVVRALEEGHVTSELLVKRYLGEWGNASYAMRCAGIHRHS
jgi:hypothetical protein